MYVWVVTQPVSNSHLHSCLLSSEFFYDNFSVFSQIEKSLNGENCFEDIYIKFKKTELVEKKSRNYLACEFTAH